MPRSRSTRPYLQQGADRRGHRPSRSGQPTHRKRRHPDPDRRAGRDPRSDHRLGDAVDGHQHDLRRRGWSNYGGIWSGTGASPSTPRAGNFIRSSGQSFSAIIVNGSGRTDRGRRAGRQQHDHLDRHAGRRREVVPNRNWSNQGTFTGSGTVTLTGASSGARLRVRGEQLRRADHQQQRRNLHAQGRALDHRRPDPDLRDAGGQHQERERRRKSQHDGRFFTGGTGTIDFTGNLLMTGGSYTGGAGTATVTSTSASRRPGRARTTLVGYWALENSSTDSSGNGNDLHLNTGTFVTSAPQLRERRHLQLGHERHDPVRVRRPCSAAVAELRPATVTISAWYKAKSVDTSGSEIVSGSNTYGLRITTTGLTVMKRITRQHDGERLDEYRVP